MKNATHTRVKDFAVQEVMSQKMSTAGTIKRARLAVVIIGIVMHGSLGALTMRIQQIIVELSRNAHMKAVQTTNI